MRQDHEDTVRNIITVLATSSPCAGIDIANRVHGQVKGGLVDIAQSTVSKTISELVELDCIKVIGKRKIPRVRRRKGRKPQGKKPKEKGGRPALLLDLSFKGLVYYLTYLNDNDSILDIIRRYRVKTEFPIFVEFEELEEIYGERIFEWIKDVANVLKQIGTVWEHESSDKHSFPARYRVKWIEEEWMREFSRFMFLFMDKERWKKENAKQKLPPKTYQLLVEIANEEIKRFKEAISEWEDSKDYFYCKS